MKFRQAGFCTSVLFIMLVMMIWIGVRRFYEGMLSFLFELMVLIVVNLAISNFDRVSYVKLLLGCGMYR